MEVTVSRLPLGKNPSRQRDGEEEVFEAEVGRLWFCA